MPLAATEFRASRRHKIVNFNEVIAMKLVAIDFETADRSADSACAIGIVSIEKGKITKKGISADSPTTTEFRFFLYPRHFVGRCGGSANLH
jgi:DNA polymerase III epsilon subunit-like protein